MGYGEARLTPLRPEEPKPDRLILRKVEAEGRPPLLARCYPRATGKARGQERRRLAGRLARRGILTPEILAVDDSYATLGRHRFELVLERWIEGRHPRPEDFAPPTSPWPARLAELLALHHGDQAPTAGRPWRRQAPVDGAFLREHFGGKLARATEALAGCDFIAWNGELGRAIRERLRRGLDELCPSPPCSLVNGDLQLGNLMLVEGERPAVALVDFGACHYGLWPWDFVKVFHQVLGRNVAAFGRLARAYFEFRPQADGAEFDRFIPFFELYYHVEKAGSTFARYRRSLRRGGSLGEAAHLRDRVERSWRGALEVFRSPLRIPADLTPSA